jgi:predicted metal-dependent hydrolase
MLLERIEKNLKKIQENINKDNFIFDFLEAYEQPKASIKRIKEGDYNLSKKQNEVIWKKKLYFYSVNANEDIHEVIDNISKSEAVEKNKIRFGSTIGISSILIITLIILAF